MDKEEKDKIINDALSKVFANIVINGNPGTFEHFANELAGLKTGFGERICMPPMHLPTVPFFVRGRGIGKMEALKMASEAAQIQFDEYLLSSITPPLSACQFTEEELERLKQMKPTPSDKTKPKYRQPGNFNKSKHVQTCAKKRRKRKRKKHGK